MTTTGTLPSVKVTAHAIHGRVTVNAYVDSLPPPADLAARAAALGLPAIRAEALAAARTSAERWLTLKKQIDAANKTLAEAAAAERRASAAKVLLETNPEDDLVAKLRRIEGEVAATRAAREAAEKDLAALRHLVAKHFCAAANVVASRAKSTAVFHLNGLADPLKAAEIQLAEASRKVEETLRRAVAEYLVPAAAEVLALQKASTWNGGVEDFVKGVLADSVGPVPEGVRVDVRGRYEEVPACPPKSKGPAPARLPAEHIDLDEIVESFEPK
jgi:hypothetical protein